MREDMDEVIIERPRRPKNKRGKEKYHRRRAPGIPLEDLPSKESHKRSHIDRRYPNENLSPLQRYLESNVGRPWNKVYSEICENLNTNSAVQYHILQHIYDFLYDKTFIGPDGRVWAKMNSRRFLRQGEEPLEDLRQRVVLYVHPVDGILKRIHRPKGWKPKPYYWESQKPEGPARVDGPTGVQYHKIDGIWYLVRLAPLPEQKTLEMRATFKNKDGKEEEWIVPTNAGCVRDVLTRSTLFHLVRHLADIKKYGMQGQLVEKYGIPGVYGAFIKQMNTRELKSAGLQNDKPEDE